MKNFIIIIFPLLAQEPKQTLELTYDSELNIKSIENYIENKGDVKVLNSLILRSLQSQIVNRDWEIADTILNHYISLIDDYYDNYDLNYIEEIRRLVQQETDNSYNVNFINNILQNFPGNFLPIYHVKYRQYSSSSTSHRRSRKTAG